MITDLDETIKETRLESSDDVVFDDENTSVVAGETDDEEQTELDQAKKILQDETDSLVQPRSIEFGSSLFLSDQRWNKNRLEFRFLSSDIDDDETVVENSSTSDV